MVVFVVYSFVFTLTFFVITLVPLNSVQPHTIKGTQIVVQEKNTIVLYIRPSCPYCISVLRALDSLDKKIPLKNISSHPEFAKELLQIGGRGQVPCMVINGKALYESREIIKWLQNNVGSY
jgi:glutaredoxin 3